MFYRVVSPKGLKKYPSVGDIIKGTFNTYKILHIYNGVSGVVENIETGIKCMNYHWGTYPEIVEDKR